MPLFKVTITEVRKKVIYVDDVDYDFEAEDKIQQQYEDYEIELLNDDYENHHIKVEEV